MFKIHGNLLFLFSPVLYFILLFRASLDPILDYTKISGIGLGALLNLIVVVLYLYIFIKEKFTVPISCLKLWGGFIIVGFISISLSPEKINSLRSFFSILTYFSFFSFGFYLVKDKLGLINILSVIIFSAILPLLYSIYELFFIYSSGGRIFGTFSHPNIFAFYLVLIVSLSFYVLKTDFLKFTPKFILLTKYIFFSSLIFLLLTKTRSAWISVIFIFLFYGVINDRKYLLYIFLAILISLFVPEVQNRVFDIFSGDSVDNLAYGESLNSYAWRKIVWLASFEYILNNPLFGHGYDTFSYYFLDFFPLEEDKGFDAHNTYVQIAFDMGFIGVFFFLVLFLFLFRRLYLYSSFDKKGGSIFMALIISYLLVGYSDNMLFYLSFNWYFWFFFGSIFFFTNNYINSFRGSKNE